METAGQQRSPVVRGAGLALGPASFAAVLGFLDLGSGDPAPTRMAAVAVWMAVWWIAEAVPLAATALLPLVLFPALGILPGRETAPLYFNSVIFLFIGGFTIALAMERWNLHRRIALWVLATIGGGPARLVLGFMVASAFLSMWISNTATAILMLTIGMTLIRETESAFGIDKTRSLAVGILLGIAYGASIGGVATLVGTPPNLSFVRIYEISFPDAPPIGFGQWMLMGVPLSATMLVVAWWLLVRVFHRVPADVRLDPATVRRQRSELGPMRFAERAVMAVFATTALLWVFRRDLVLGPVVVPGWGRLLPHGDLVDDGTVAVAMALLLFVLPAREPAASGGGPARLLGPEVFARIPWGIVLLFGGGFALAQGFQTTGLSGLVGERAAGLAGSPPVVTVAAVSAMLTFLTELTSNTATVEMILPILAAVGEAMRIDPLLLMVPATLSASFAFMMPVATPPNAIVFAGGRLRVAEMARIGIVLNLVGIAVITALFYTLGTAALGIAPGPPASGGPP